MAKRPPTWRARPVKPRKGNWDKDGRPSAHARGYGWDWQKLRAKVLKRDRGLCVVCLGDGVTTLATDVDHVIPKSRGGTDDEANLQSLCDAHHKAKTALEAKQAKAARTYGP